MGNSSPSHFNSHSAWNIRSSKDFKSVLENRNTHEIYEKHVLEAETELLKSQTLIYEWRNSKSIIREIVEIVHMEYKQKQIENNCNFNFCAVGQNNKLLQVFTEYIYKFYEKSGFSFSQEEQVGLFRGLIEGIDMISKKLGFFALNKEMIGYNKNRVGKFWINQNYASNLVQLKRQIKTRAEELDWQREIIQTMIESCSLSQRKMDQNLFPYIVEQIKSHHLYDFQGFRAFYNPKQIQSKIIHFQASQTCVRNTSHNIRQERYSLGSRNSNENENKSSTKDNEKKSNQKYNQKYQQKLVMKEKKYVMVPISYIKKVYPVTEQQRQQINRHIRNTYHYPIQNHEQFTQTYSQEPVNFNHVQTETHIHSLINRPQTYLQNEPNNEATKKLVYSKNVNRNQINTRNIQNKEEFHLPLDSRHNLMMVDSMIIVENQSQSNEEYKRNTQIILQESFILQGMNQ